MENMVVTVKTEKRLYNKYALCKGDELEAMQLFHSKRNGRTYVDYREYIESDEWSKKRLARVKMDGYKCQMCGTAKNLVVHHITYDRLGHESLDDLITLCHNCHEKIHSVDIVEKHARSKDNEESVIKKPVKRGRKKCKGKKMIKRKSV